jgi:stringent starvation protein B
MTSTANPPSAAGSSTRPYLIRALHEWCTDNGFTPYVAVLVGRHVRVPVEYVKNSEIVLNVSIEATSTLTLGNEFIEFKARFGGVLHEIMVPVDHVIAIYARENGQGMAFPMAPENSLTELASDEELAPSLPPVPVGLKLMPNSSVSGEGNRDDSVEHADSLLQPTHPPSGGGRPSLKRIK